MVLTDWREQHLQGPKLTSQEKAVIAVTIIFVILLVGGLIAVVVVETRNETMCGGAITNTPNAPKPTPPPS